MTLCAVRLAPLVAAALLAACQAAEDRGDAAPQSPPAPPGGAASAPDAPHPVEQIAVEALPSPSDTAAPAAPARPVPHIYMALQPGGTGRPTSVVFAIDAARDGTPSDDPAVRLTPDAGRCNPQEMRRYDFPPDAAAQPAVGETEAALGLTAQDLPRFLAAAVTGRMIEAGLASEPEATRGLNDCTRKLWERLVVAQNREALAAGQ